METDPELAHIKLAEKLTNQHTSRYADQAQIVLNAYRLSLKHAVQRVYKYELKFMCTYRKGEKEKIVDLSAGPKNDVAMHTRRRLLWELFQQMLTNENVFFGGRERAHELVYDCGINFYSLAQLLPLHGTKTFLLDKDSLCDSSQYYLGKSATDLSAYLLAVGSFDLGDMERRGNFADRSAIQFIEVLSNQLLLKQDGYLMFGNRMFKKDSNIRLQNDARILKEGFQKNIRMVGDTVEDALVIMQIDPKKSAFYPEMAVHHFLESFLPGRGDLLDKLSGGKRLAVQQLKGLSVVTTHLSANRVFVVHNIADEDSDSTTFDRDGRSISVTDYFRDAYSYSLRHPRLPVVVERRRNGFSYYPMEVLKIVGGQRVSLNKQTGNLTEQMIRNCQALPAKFRAAMEQQKENACLSGGNPFLKAYGINVDSQLVSANAQVLFPPAIVYQNHDREEPSQRGEMNWKLAPRRRFAAPATLPKVWAAVIIQGGVNGNSCQDFIRRIVDAANQRGMGAHPPMRYDMFNSADPVYIRERFNYFKKNECRFVMFFTADKLDPVHHTIKLMEIETGIITQHICDATMSKALGNKGAFLVIDNVLLKLNMKLGGVNHTLSTANEFRGRGSNSAHDVVAKDWFGASRMFIGIDMSHAGAQSLYDRQTSARVEPSVVGMSYTVGASLKMLGTYWIQEARVTHVQHLKNPVVKALKDFADLNGSYPRHLIVYRGGVSDGDYRQVVRHEGGELRNAFASIFNGDESKYPEVTIVVVQKNSNYRIVPQRINEGSRPVEQNVRPGTVLDAHYMHPAYTEFLLVGHKAIQGTAKPVRCTVITDSERRRIPLEELEHMTYALCYAHGIVTSPVSVPAPLYAAGDLAKRGANNWKIDSDDIAKDLPSNDEEIPDFFKSVNDKLKPTIKTKFWA